MFAVFSDRGREERQISPQFQLFFGLQSFLYPSTETTPYFSRLVNLLILTSQRLRFLFWKQDCARKRSCERSN